MRKPKSSFSISLKNAGTTELPDRVHATGANYEVEIPANLPRLDMVVGSICNTRFYCPNMETNTRVAVLSFRESFSQTGTLVKIQRWKGDAKTGQMFGKTAELDLAWLTTTGDYWLASECPFDDDIPF